MRGSWVWAVAVGLALAAGVARADFAAGLAAALAGDNATAIAEWAPLAEAGIAEAQFNLGLMFGKGEGVPRDNITAHKWANLSAANGNDRAPALRDAIAAAMTPADVSEAQRRARACLASNYTACD